MTQLDPEVDLRIVGSHVGCCVLSRGPAGCCGSTRPGVPLLQVSHTETVVAGNCGLSLLTTRVGYVPFQTFKRCGIKGPDPLPFIGNIREMKKMVCSSFLPQTHACITV